jgi:EAL domain-containing protein (putative c-di-GMP-specific phosphodiesterase class I)/PleD family two-component response regulator
VTSEHYDVIHILDEPGEEGVLQEDTVVYPASVSAAPWKILVVDDDVDVHEATEFALRKITILGRKLELIHAYSGEEGNRVFNANSDIAVLLLDVVMEEEHAGLQLVRQLREQGHHKPRIILRTGHPGYAPESRIIRDYDINDYRTKDELTRTRLITTLTASIRAYDYINMLEQTRSGLELIIESTRDLYHRRSFDLFAQGVLVQLAALLRLEPEGAICAIGPSQDENNTIHALPIIAGLGRFSEQIGLDIASLPGIDIDALSRLPFNHHEPVLIGKSIAMRFAANKDRELLVYFEHAGGIEKDAISLLRLFSGNLALCFENLALIKRLDELAFVDQKLGIPNHNAYFRKLSDIIDIHNKDCHVALVSIDEAPQFAVAFGMEFIDRLILAVHSRMKVMIGKDIFVARLGEFRLAVIDENCVIGEAILSSVFDHAFMIEDNNITLSATIGVVREGVKNHESVAVDRAVRTTLLRATQKTPGRAMLYTPDLEDNIARSVQLRAGLHDALQNGDIAFHFQPQLALGTGALIGAEVLARWTFKGAPVSPAYFIPVAEKSGMISELTFQALRAVGLFVAKRKAQALPEIRVSLNLSVSDINQKEFIPQLLKNVRDADLTPATLQFEITESFAVQGASDALVAINKLKDAGFRLSLDDFGTGFSSLSYLDHLPIDEVKIDRSFVSPLQVVTARQSIAASTQTIADNLGLEVLAEGVETVEQHQILRFIGVKFVQGFLYGRPMPEADFMTWEQNWDMAKVVNQ